MRDNDDTKKTRTERYREALAGATEGMTVLRYAPDPGALESGTPIDIALVDAFDRHPDADITVVPLAAWRALVNILGSEARFVKLGADVEAIELHGHPCGSCYVAWDGQQVSAHTGMTDNDNDARPKPSLLERFLGWFE